jgi:ethanolamine phosphate transferase 2 subunit G
MHCPIEPEGEFHYYDTIEQSDLVPTISTLLGWTIPQNNIGVILRSVFSHWKGNILSLHCSMEMNEIGWQR